LIIVNGESRAGEPQVIIVIVGKQSKFPFGLTHDRYQRDELLSTDKCEELKKRIDKEISDAEKRSAVDSIQDIREGN
jgi:hypothetical protein